MRVFAFFFSLRHCTGVICVRSNGECFCFELLRGIAGLHNTGTIFRYRRISWGRCNVILSRCDVSLCRKMNIELCSVFRIFLIIANVRSNFYIHTRETSFMVLTYL